MPGAAPTPFVVRQVASALQHVHGAKILHRDLKAANVFLTAAGATKLGDFGVARERATASDLAQTVCGTPYYMSPELVMGEAYGEPSDVWALGVLLFELVALARPFGADSVAALVMSISKGEYDEEALAASSHPRALVELVSRDGLLAPSPRARPTLAALAGRLQQLDVELGGADAARADEPAPEAI